MKISKDYSSEILHTKIFYISYFLLFRNFKRSNNQLPQLSYIPTCFYSEEAYKFWNTRDYSYLDVVASHASYDNYKESLKFEDPDIYKYPKCKKFNPKPTDSSICHTFNGLDLEQILKSSNWMDAYQEAFTGAETDDILKSVGVDTDSGFIFSLDTMQSYMITKKQRHLEHIPINSFLIKVHPPGELPIMSEDKSSWQRISSHQDEMITHFLTVKGEKVSSTVSL